MPAVPAVQTVRWIRAFALDAIGGPARGRVVLTLAAVRGSSGAGTDTISATTGNLERAFVVGNTQIGLLLSVVGPVGAAFTGETRIPRVPSRITDVTVASAASTGHA